MRTRRLSLVGFPHPGTTCTGPSGAPLTRSSETSSKASTLTDPLEITSIEEWERLVGKPTPEEIEKLIHEGMIHYLRDAPPSDAYDEDK